MFDQDASGTIDVNEFEKLYGYINQWLAVFKTYDRDQSGHIEEQELSQGEMFKTINKSSTADNPSVLFFSFHSNGIPFLPAVRGVSSEEMRSRQQKANLSGSVHCFVRANPTLHRGVPGSRYRAAWGDHDQLWGLPERGDWVLHLRRVLSWCLLKKGLIFSDILMCITCYNCHVKLKFNSRGLDFRARISVWFQSNFKIQLIHSSVRLGW